MQYKVLRLAGHLLHERCCVLGPELYCSRNRYSSLLMVLQMSVEALTEMGEQLRVSKNNLEGELAKTQKLSGLYKNNSEKKTGEVQILKNTLRDCRAHIEAWPFPSKLQWCLLRSSSPGLFLAVRKIYTVPALVFTELLAHKC